MNIMEMLRMVVLLGWIGLRFVAGQSTTVTCDPCKRVGSDTNLYINIGTSSECIDSCLYRYEGNGEHFCFVDGNEVISSCMSTEFFLTAGGLTSTSTQLRSVIAYGSDGSLVTLPDLPEDAGDIRGGYTNKKILLCLRTNCYTWTRDSPTSWNLESVTAGLITSSAVSTDQGVWFTGGTSAIGHPDNLHTTLISIDSNGDAVSTTAMDITSERFYHCAIENGNSPILTGGFRLASNEYLDLVEQYNLQAGTVDRLPDLLLGRINHGCTKFRSNPTDFQFNLIVAGGWNNGQYTDKAEILRPGATAWEAISDIPQFRLFTSMATLLDVPLMVGGAAIDGGWVYRNDIIDFNLSTNAWENFGTTLNPGRRFMATFNIPRDII